MNVEAAFSVLRPVSGFSTALIHVWEGLCLSCCIDIHRNWVAWHGDWVHEVRRKDILGKHLGFQVRGGWSQCGIGQFMRGLKSFIHRTILIHLNSKAEPHIQICVWRPSHSHLCKGCRDLMVQTLTKLDHNGFGAGVPWVLNEVLECVKVVIDWMFALEVVEFSKVLMAAASASSGRMSFRNSFSKSSQSIKRRWPVFVSSSNLCIAQWLAHPVFIYNITHMIFVSLSSKGSGHSQMYVRQDVRNALPALLSPEKLGGKAGLRKMFL